MSGRGRLEDAVADLLSFEKAYDVAAVCVRYGLADQGEDDPWKSKARYVGRRLKSLTDRELENLARKVADDYREREGYSMAVARLQETIRMNAGASRVSEITRRAIAGVLDDLGYGQVGGRRGIIALLEASLPDLDLAPGGYGSLGQEIRQHMVRNDDWNYEFLFEQVGLIACSDQRLFRFLEEVVHPLSRRDDEQERYVAAMNTHLERDGFTLVHVGEVSGYPTYGITSSALGVGGRPKNLIFASTGPKPEIVLDDAVNNDLRIVRHAEHCLIYDEPFPDGTFTWGHLVDWWARSEGLDTVGRAAETALYRRLRASVSGSSSPPEQLLFRTYYGLRRELGKELPVLLPQVYLHFDPATLKMLGGVKRLVRQRMDFLMLLGRATRIVLEVDGAQHYSDGGSPSPQRYAEMVAEDRRLKLAGYQVYRFGGYELQPGGGEELVREFFLELLDRHGVT